MFYKWNEASEIQLVIWDILFTSICNVYIFKKVLKIWKRRPLCSPFFPSATYKLFQLSSVCWCTCQQDRPLHWLLMQGCMQWLKAAPSSPAQLCIHAVSWIGLLQNPEGPFQKHLTGALHLFPPLWAVETNAHNPPLVDQSKLHLSKK